MKYEIVEINEKIVIGLSDRIKNNDTMLEKIINLWNNFCNENGGIINKINKRINENTVAIYYNYNNEKDGYKEIEYDNLVGCEVENQDTKNELTKVVIPKGKYAKFTFFGNPDTEVNKFWRNFWVNVENKVYDFDRAFTYDFEEYIAGNDFDNMEVDIYISIK